MEGGGVADMLFRDNQGEVNREQHEWWQTGVVYQVYLRSFKDTTGNGVGDLQGVIDEMDYLTDTLGIDAIWISPFYPSPMADFGYDVSDYRDVHPMFGDLSTFDRLVARAHDAGLKVIIDFVPSACSSPSISQLNRVPLTPQDSPAGSRCPPSARTRATR